MITKAAKETKAQEHLEKNKAHIAEFQQAIDTITEKLKTRAKTHDASKLKEPELTQYTEAEEKLEKFKPGSPEYLKIRDKYDIILSKHFTKNPHHPEHFKNGFNDMSILDLLDVLTDWRLDCGDGDWNKFVDDRRDYYRMDDQVVRIFKNSKKIF